jgi:transposase
MERTWYGNLVDLESAALGSLAVIAPLLQRMGIADIIDRHLPADEQAEFPHGTILSVLIAARVYSPMALSNIPNWATQSGADLLWQMPVEKMNDDRFGRSLDAFFEQRHSILTAIALPVAEEFDVPLGDLHYDPTHVLFSGAYEMAQPRDGVVGVAEDGQTPIIRSDADLDPAHITKGRAMDDAPNGSRMIHVGLGVLVDEFGPLPICGHTIDGNQNGRTAVHEQTALLTKHCPPLKLTMISDRGTYSVGHLLRLDDSGCSAICSAPWGDYRELFDQHRSSLVWKRATFLSLEQQRRRESSSELPQEHYDLAVLKQMLKDDETGREIAVRVLFVKSTADEKVVRQQRQKQIDRLTTELQKIQASVTSGRRHTDTASVTKRVARVLGEVSAAKYFRWELRALTKAEIKQLPPPGRGCRRPTQRFEFTFDTALLKADEQYDGDNAIVTTVPPSKASADELFTRFKQQSYSEQVNSQFKGPLAVRPVFLHSPRRVEALMFLMVIALMLYYLIQRTYRASLPKDSPTKERRITTRTLLGSFQNYTLLIHHVHRGREVSPTRLTSRQQEILRRLELPTPAQFLRRLLPRPPD